MTTVEIIRYLQKQLEEVWFENIQLRREVKIKQHIIDRLKAELKLPWYKRIFK